jgi:hypothetical protein
MQVSLERSLSNDGSLALNHLGNQLTKNLINVCRYFFSLAEFDCFLYTFVLPLEPCFTLTLIVPLITDYDWCILLDPPLILGVIQHKNLRLKKIQRLLSLTKAWHCLVIDVFKCIFKTEVANLLHLRNFAILQDSWKRVRSWQRYFARSARNSG